MKPWIPVNAVLEGRCSTCLLVNPQAFDNCYVGVIVLDLQQLQRPIGILHPWWIPLTQKLSALRFNESPLWFFTGAARSLGCCSTLAGEKVTSLSPSLFFSISSSFSFFLILLLKNKFLGSTHRGFSEDLCHMRTLLWEAVGSMYSERLGLKEALGQQEG